MKRILLEKLQDSLRLLIRLSQHRLSGLGKDVLLGVVHHFLGHVCVADAAVGGLHVLGRGVEVVDGVLEAVLESAEVAAVRGNLVDGILYGLDGGAGSFPIGYAQSSNAQSVGGEVVYADGDMVLVMDADLQHPPELIPEMVKAWRDEGYDVVEGIKKTRGRENPFYRICAKFFYYIIYKTADIDLGQASDYKLMDRSVVEAWKELPERATFFRGMSAWLGYERKQIPFDVAERVNGKSKWSLLRLIRLAVNAITSYTSVPLHCITVMGVLMFFGAIILGIQTLYMKFSGRATSGFTTVILLLLIIGSSLMISLGMIGIYLSKIYKEVKHRPRYLVAKCIKADESSQSKQEAL